LDVLLYGVIITYSISYLINLYFSRKIIDVPFRKEIKVILITIAICIIISAISIGVISHLSLTDFQSFLLIIPILIGYLALLELTKVFHFKKELVDLFQIIKK